MHELKCAFIQYPKDHYLIYQSQGCKPLCNIQCIYTASLDCIPRKSLPFSAFTHVSAASYRAARSSVMLYFFFRFFDTKYIAAAPAYFTVIFSVKLKLPAVMEPNLRIPITKLKQNANLILVFQHTEGDILIIKSVKQYDRGTLNDLFIHVMERGSQKISINH